MPKAEEDEFGHPEQKAVAAVDAKFHGAIGYFGVAAEQAAEQVLLGGQAGGERLVAETARGRIRCGRSAFLMRLIIWWATAAVRSGPSAVERAGSASVALARRCSRSSIG